MKIDNNNTYQYFFNVDTSSYVYSYRPISLYIYEYKNYPYYALNPLVRGLCFQDSKFSNASHLFLLTENVNSADFILFPCDLNFFEHRENQLFAFLTHYEGNERRHIFFDDRDQATPFPSEESICIKVSLNSNRQLKNVFCIPYMDMVDDFYYYFIKKRQIIYDVSFLGQKNEFRQTIIESLKKSNIRIYGEFVDEYFHQDYFAYKDEPPAYNSNQNYRRTKLRQEFIKITLASKFVLAIQGYGLNSYRFYEALSLGVPPILISKNCALPYEDKIDYDSFIIRIDVNDSEFKQKISEIVNTIDDNKYESMCKLCRFHYDTFFAPQKFNYILHNKLISLLKNNIDQGDI